jgi:glycosyltransferase involved in cell wall biosynthesis
MANAAIYLNPEAYHTGGKALMGRHSAGESFLKGFLRHSSAERFFFWDVANKPQDELKGLIDKLGGVNRPVTWIPRDQRNQLSEPGCLFSPVPNLSKESWARRPYGPHIYSICGITHTTATDRVMDAIGEMLIAPIEPWDALICTSRAVRASVEIELEAVEDDLRARLGATKLPSIRLETIPLGINTSDFTFDPGSRKRWREELKIPDAAVVALYVGRFNHTGKVHPVPMAIALERAARATGKDIHLIMSGWPMTEKSGPEYHDTTRGFCPSVKYHAVDGRKPEVRFSIWSAADFFVSLSDNIQETYGLTPLEAMTVGLPTVVSDWDGYRDTVRHGIDGFRISTYTPRGGMGREIAYRYDNQWISYEAYVGSVCQFTAVDMDETVRAMVDLIEKPELRKRMGRAAQEFAVQNFDWRNIIPKYEELWRDLIARRKAQVLPQQRNLSSNPWRLDPFQLFGPYPTEWVSPNTLVSLTPGQTADEAKRLLSSPLISFAGFLLPRPEEIDVIFTALTRARQAQIRDVVASLPPSRRGRLERGILFLAKYGVVRILPQSDAISS